MKPQIVAMGGGGFATEPENLLLEQYVLSLSRNRTRPRVCFLPTASGDSENYIERFYTSFGELDAVPSHLPLFGLTVRDIRAFLLGQDVIFVGGGNTLNMLPRYLGWQSQSGDDYYLTLTSDWRWIRVLLNSQPGIQRFCVIANKSRLPQSHH